MRILEMLLDLDKELKYICDIQLKESNIKMRKIDKVEMTNNAWKYTSREIKRTAIANYLKNIEEK